MCEFFDLDPEAFTPKTAPQWPPTEAGLDTAMVVARFADATEVLKLDVKPLRQTFELYSNTLLAVLRACSGHVVQWVADEVWMSAWTAPPFLHGGRLHGPATVCPLRRYVHQVEWGGGLP